MDVDIIDKDGHSDCTVWSDYLTSKANLIHPALHATAITGVPDFNIGSRQRNIELGFEQHCLFLAPQLTTNSGNYIQLKNNTSEIRRKPLNYAALFDPGSGSMVRKGVAYSSRP